MRPILSRLAVPLVAGCLAALSLPLAAGAQDAPAPPQAPTAPTAPGPPTAPAPNGPTQSGGGSSNPGPTTGSFPCKVVLGQIKQYQARQRKLIAKDQKLLAQNQKRHADQLVEADRDDIIRLRSAISEASWVRGVISGQCQNQTTDPSFDYGTVVPKLRGEFHRLATADTKLRATVSTTAQARKLAKLDGRSEAAQKFYNVVNRDAGKAGVHV